MNVTWLSFFVLFGLSQLATQGLGTAVHKGTIKTVSPDRRYEVRFSDGRSGGNAAGKLWGMISIRDLRAGKERIARVAVGQRGRGIFEGFNLFEGSQDWSPDGLYLAYWDNHCQAESSVPGGVVCHLHEVHFLTMNTVPACREELVLSRYAFGGWARGQAHTVLEILINEDGQKAQRFPCAGQKSDEVLPNVPVRDADQAIALFQGYWESIVLPGLQEKSRDLGQGMSDRVRRKKLSARLASYREIYSRVTDTLTPSEREKLILHGALADLDRQGQCWVIESFIGCPCSEIAGYIDAKTGQLIFVWIMPEG